MIKLNQSASQYLQLITGQNGAVVDVSYSDKSSADFLGDSQLTSIVTATTTTICDTPAASVVRYIDFIAITNTFAGNHTITVQQNSSATAYPIVKDLVMSVGDRLEYTHACGWRVVDSTGAIHTLVATPQVVIAAGKTFTVNNSITLSGTDGTTQTFPSVSSKLISEAAIQAQSVTAFTTAGTSTAYTLTPSPAITAYAIGQEFDIIFNAACGATPTIAISGLAAVNLVDRLVAGTYYNIPAGRIPINWRSKCVMVSATQMLVRDTPSESVSSTVLAASSIALANNVGANVTSISIPPGDWDIFGNCYFTPGSTTNVVITYCSSSLTSATLGAQNSLAGSNHGSVVIGSSNEITPLPTTCVSFSVATTYYLVAYSSFTISTMSVYGTITAKRYK